MIGHDTDRTRVRHGSAPQPSSCNEARSGTRKEPKAKPRSEPRNKTRPRPGTKPGTRPKTRPGARLGAIPPRRAKASDRSSDGPGANRGAGSRSMSARGDASICGRRPSPSFAHGPSFAHYSSPARDCQSRCRELSAGIVSGEGRRRQFQRGTSNGPSGADFVAGVPGFVLKKSRSNSMTAYTAARRSYGRRKTHAATRCWARCCAPMRRTLRRARGAARIRPG